MKSLRSIGPAKNRFFVKNLIIEVAPKNISGKGERNFIPLDSKAPCWTTNSTCWCTCGGCTSLTSNGTAWTSVTVSRYKNLEKNLMIAVKELRRRQAFLNKDNALRKKRKKLKK